jgi:hypothetical protein
VRAAALAALAALAACATGVPVQRQVVVPGDRFVAVQGEAGLFVRTFLPPEGRDRREVVGAECRIVSSLYETELVTPSRLVVPNFGPQSPEIVASCRAGDRTGAGRTRIVTRWQQSPWAWGYPGPGVPGAWGPGWGGPGWAPGWGWYEPSYPVSDYPDLIVTLR